MFASADNWSGDQRRKRSQLFPLVRVTLASSIPTDATGNDVIAVNQPGIPEYA